MKPQMNNEPQAGLNTVLCVVPPETRTKHGCKALDLVSARAALHWCDLVGITF